MIAPQHVCHYTQIVVSVYYDASCAGGRAQEVPGEDSTVVADYGAAFISGLQGAGAGDDRYLLAAATAKHFVA